MFSPHLCPSHPHSHAWQLVQRITSVSSLGDFPSIGGHSLLKGFSLIWGLSLLTPPSLPQVCPPKEMVLALLEQMQILSSKKPLVVFMMLAMLKNGWLTKL